METCKIKPFAKIINNFQLLIIFAKSFILDVRMCFECVFENSIDILPSNFIDDGTALILPEFNEGFFVCLFALLVFFFLLFIVVVIAILYFSNLSQIFQKSNRGGFVVIVFCCCCCCCCFISFFFFLFFWACRLLASLLTKETGQYFPDNFMKFL